MIKRKEREGKSPMKKAILVSACLLGRPCRYDGASKPCPAVQALAEKYDVIPVCPESMGGLVIPRLPSERRGEGVYSKSGQDVTAEFFRGAALTLEAARKHNVAFAVLKARSPSCGHGEVYDGSFTGTLRPGNGVAAELLLQNGIPVYHEGELDLLPSDGE